MRWAVELFDVHALFENGVVAGRKDVERRILRKRERDDAMTMKPMRMACCCAGSRAATQTRHKSI